MEENEEKMVNSCKPVFTRQWLCVRVLFVTVVSLFMTLVASGFDALAFGRKEEFLAFADMLNQSGEYEYKKEAASLYHQYGKPAGSAAHCGRRLPGQIHDL